MPAKKNLRGSKSKTSKTVATKPIKATKSSLKLIPTQHALVENLQPSVDGGLFPVKAVPGELIEVTADIFRDGHDKCEADLLYRRKGEKTWQRTPMSFVDNDLWGGEFTVDAVGNWEFTIEARTVGLGAAVGATRRVAPTAAAFETPYLHPHFGTVRVDARLTEYSAWYEMFARSQGTVPGKSATFADMENRLHEIKGMGFDLIYLPPIHPIGMTKRKGKNNSLTAQPGEPGSPYAIGGKEGGHKTVHPELGTLADCRHFFKRCKEMGFAVALDFALNCSPDHPYAKKHPDWFYREKDGTIKCAENPPKRYEDIYPLNFFCEDRANLWLELKSVIEFWIDMGVTVFRVDNPHTKPFAFWEWLITEIKSKRPDVAFLAEAFTRPKVMKRLAKIGFDLSYTYFTWRETAQELREYLEELTQQDPKLYMKPIFFPTTPDILPYPLQNAGREAFQIRFALASTLVGAYGMYNGYELCEGTPYPGKEEYGNSEKYEYKVWDWNRPGNIKEFIGTLNRIRKEHPALHKLKNLTFHDCENPQMLVYSKAEGDDVLLFVVNLDPLHRQGGFMTLDLNALQVKHENIFGVHDLLSGESYAWSGARNYVELEPKKQVLHILKVEKF